LFYKLFIVKNEKLIKYLIKYSWVSSRNLSQEILNNSNNSDPYEVSFSVGQYTQKEKTDIITTSLKIRDTPNFDSKVIAHPTLFQTMIYNTLDRIFKNSITVKPLKYIDLDYFKDIAYEHCYNNLINYNRFDLKIIVMHPILFNKLNIPKQGNVYHLDSNIKHDLNTMFKISSTDTDKNFYYILSDQIPYKEDVIIKDVTSHIETKILIFNSYENLVLIEPTITFEKEINKKDNIFTDYTINYKFLNQIVLLENIYKNTISIPVSATYRLG